MRAVNRHKESSKKTLFFTKTTSESKNDEENLFLFWERLGTPNFSSAWFWISLLKHLGTPGNDKL
ncbi:MAG: hypothetical protein BWX67_02353 [Thermotogae bacterium ADurb.Bin062]|nr:MAG: hypothetical protein BWX67_02353 [Thermotogota bacterium ADurb.Bin062]